MQIQQSATFNKTLNILNVLANQGAKYCLRMPDGTTYGNLDIPEDGKKRKQFSKLRKHGAIAEYLQDYLDPLAAGDVVQIPMPDLPDLTESRFQSAICGRAHKLWGIGSYTTLQGNGFIEVLRTK